MTRFIMPRPHLIPPQTPIIPRVRPVPQFPEVATGMFTVAVEVILVDAGEVLRWERGQVALAHDLLADVVDAVACCWEAWR